MLRGVEGFLEDNVYPEVLITAAAGAENRYYDCLSSFGRSWLSPSTD